MSEQRVTGMSEAERESVRAAFERDVWAREFNSLPTAVERILASRDARLGECICNTGPGTDGPDECCPEHGRSYQDWIDRGDALAARLAAIEALVDEPPAPYPAECACPHGMGFQFHRWPCRYAGDIAKASIRAALHPDPSEESA